MDTLFLELQADVHGPEMSSSGPVVSSCKRATNVKMYF